MSADDDTPEVLKRLAAKEQQRREERDKKRREAADKRNPNESTDKFLHEFQQRIRKVAEDVKGIKGEREQVETACTARIAELAELEGYVSKAAYYLPPFDVRQSRLTIADLRNKIEDLRTKLAPKKKFTFTKKTKTDKSQSSAATISTIQDTQSASAPSKEFTQKRLDGKEGEEVRVTEEELGARGFAVTNCKNCVVLLQGTILALQLRNLEACVVVVYLASAQVRIHNTSKTKLHLRVRSNPIIEDSTELVFGPLESTGTDSLKTEHDRQLLINGSNALCEENGLWSSVDDFNWLKESPSPNWTSIKNPSA